MWAPVRSFLRKFGVTIPEVVVLTDPDFGPVRLKDTYGRLHAPWAGGMTEFNFNADPSQGPPFPVIEIVRKLVGDSQDWDRRARSIAIRDMLAELNDHWLGEGETPLEGADLDAAMSLQVIWVDADGSLDLYYDCEALLGGHAIQVEGSVQTGLVSAHMA